MNISNRGVVFYEWIVVLFFILAFISASLFLLSDKQKVLSQDIGVHASDVEKLNLESELFLFSLGQSAKYSSCSAVSDSNIAVGSFISTYFLKGDILTFSDSVYTFAAHTFTSSISAELERNVLLLLKNVFFHASINDIDNSIEFKGSSASVIPSGASLKFVVSALQRSTPLEVSAGFPLSQNIVELKGVGDHLISIKKGPGLFDESSFSSSVSAISTGASSSNIPAAISSSDVSSSLSSTIFSKSLLVGKVAYVRPAFVVDIPDLSFDIYKTIGSDVLALRSSCDSVYKPARDDCVKNKMRDFNDASPNLFSWVSEYKFSNDFSDVYDISVFFLTKPSWCSDFKPIKFSLSFPKLKV